MSLKKVGCIVAVSLSLAAAAALMGCQSGEQTQPSNENTQSNVSAKAPETNKNANQNVNETQPEENKAENTDNETVSVPTIGQSTQKPPSQSDE